MLLPKLLLLLMCFSLSLVCACAFFSKIKKLGNKDDCLDLSHYDHLQQYIWLRRGFVAGLENAPAILGFSRSWDSLGCVRACASVKAHAHARTLARTNTHMLKPDTHTHAC